MDPFFGVFKHNLFVIVGVQEHKNMNEIILETYSLQENKINILIFKRSNIVSLIETKKYNWYSLI